MAYNNYFPTNYYPYPQQTYYPQMQMQTQTSNSIIWVNNEAEAQNYPVAPNNAVVLWDSNKAAIYLKQADASGRPTFKAFDLVEQKIADSSKENDKNNISIEKSDLDALRDEIGALMTALKSDMDIRKSGGKKKDE